MKIYNVENHEINRSENYLVNSNEQQSALNFPFTSLNVKKHLELKVNLKQNQKNTTEIQRTQSLINYLTLSSLCLCGENIQQVEISILIFLLCKNLRETFG